MKFLAVFIAVVAVATGSPVVSVIPLPAIVEPIVTTEPAVVSAAVPGLLIQLIINLNVAQQVRTLTKY